MNKPEALRLAALLDATHFSEHAHPAAAELRRLHAEVEWLKQSAAEVEEGCTPADARVLREANHNLAAENHRLHDDVTKLRAFAQAIMKDWQEFAGIDPGDLQDIANEHGILERTIQHQPCGENCNCEWYAEPLKSDWEEGVPCYLPTPLLRGQE